MKLALKLPVLALALATLSAGAYAQNPDNAVTGSAPSTQTQPAPITRNPAGRVMPKINTLQPTAGVLVRSDADSSVRTVATGAANTELRVERGRATIEINHPKENSQITVDLPGGQVDLLKDGLYTFNAETNTVRVLRGEASAYAGSATSGKAVKVKEDKELTFGATGKLRSVDADPRELTADLVPGPGAERVYAGGGYGRAYGPGYGPYGDGFVEYPYAPYPYYGFGYPYGWGYPYYGYPFGFGLGFGFYGRGFYGGGFRGGFRR